MVSTRLFSLLLFASSLFFVGCGGDTAPEPSNIPKIPAGTKQIKGAEPGSKVPVAPPRGR